MRYMCEILLSNQLKDMHLHTTCITSYHVYHVIIHDLHFWPCNLSCIAPIDQYLQRYGTLQTDIYICLYQIDIHSISVFDKSSPKHRTDICGQLEFWENHILAQCYYIWIQILKNHNLSQECIFKLKKK